MDELYPPISTHTLGATMRVIGWLQRSTITLTTLIVMVTPTLAHDLLGEAGDHWSQGANLESKGDFDSAIIQYDRALQAVKTLGNPQLRACGAMGSISRLAGAEAGKSYIQTHGNSPADQESALAVSRNRFRQVSDQIVARYPELESSCP